MKPFHDSFAEFPALPQKPDFNQLLKILNRQKPDRPTLFEFFLNDTLYDLFSDRRFSKGDGLDRYRRIILAYECFGYDYMTIVPSAFSFPNKRNSHGKFSASMNDSAVIFDRESFEAYPWPDPDAFDFSCLEQLKDTLPYGMKMIPYGPGGVLENVIALLGYENLCYLIVDDPELVQDIFEAVGSRFVRFYEICCTYDSVGAIISNDDWGFNTQTMLSSYDMRKYVFPWHKRIAEIGHSHHLPVILHSCGQLERVMDDLIDDIGFDAKHSYEDKIMPVEQAYNRYSSRIAVLGGIDVDFVCRSTPLEIYTRACDLIKQTQNIGYAIGTGNSIPAYVPHENFFALISAVLQNR